LALGFPDGARDGDGLLERSEQSALLDAALAAVATSGSGRTALVLGEAGIGKTALLRGFSDGVAGSARVLSAACDHLFTPRPLGPFLDLAETAGGQLAARAGDAARPHDVAAALLAELGSGGTTVVVLEDVHWADEASLDVVRLLFRRIEAVPALLVLSYRDDELDRSHPLRLVLGDLAASGRVTRVELGGLSRAAVATLACPQVWMPGNCTPGPAATRSS
jgi:predicted ATPase